MTLRLRSIAVAAVLCALAGLARADDWLLDGVRRVVAISDIHGAHQEFIATLQAAEVIDAALHWRAADTHLVIVGDIVDRGDDSRQTMDLLMRLEPEAAAAGGRVHVVLGNHDLMNLVGDPRYTTRGEYAAFAGEESAAMREASLRRHLEKRARAGATADAARREFDQAYPPGFFAHRAAFAASARYGKWLLGKPLLLQIDGTLFIHAGMSPAVAAIGRTAVNGALREELIEYAGVLEQLTAQGVVDPATDFYALPEDLGVSRATVRDPAVLARIDRLLALHESMLHGAASPAWYRGNVACGPLIEQDRLEAALRTFSGARIVVGHTPTWRRRVWSRLDGRVVQIDTGMLRSYYSGQGAALLLEGDRMRAIYQGDAEAVPVDAQPARAGTLAADLGAEELERALAEAGIAGDPPASSGGMVTLKWHGKELQAEFLPARAGFAPDVAAYRLDRLLSLDMVPAAVLRTVNGTAGSLRHVPAATVTETERAAGKAALEAWCPLQDQFQAMYLFDALVYNPGRTTDHILFARQDGALILTGHALAFGTRTGVPPYLRKARPTPNAMWRDKLAGLRTGQARAALREVLGEKRLEALLTRADKLAD